MIRITFEEIASLHDRIPQQSSAAPEDPRRWRDGSAPSCPNLYPTLVEKASWLGSSPIVNLVFVDGEKRIGSMKIEVFLARSGLEITGAVDDLESTEIRLTAGEIDRETFVDLLRVPGAKSAP